MTPILYHSKDEEGQMKLRIEEEVKKARLNWLKQAQLEGEIGDTLTEGQTLMVENWLKRVACYQRVKLMIKYTTQKGYGKGQKKRMVFLYALEHYAEAPFKNEEEEYKGISKFGRGMWREDIVTSFPEEIQKIIIDDIAVEYGAFDY
jgi:hypothetical protein